MTNFFTEINQPTIARQQKLFSELFMQALVENTQLMDWTRDNWRSVIKRKADQDFLEFAIEKLELMSQKHQEKIKRLDVKTSSKSNTTSSDKNAFQEEAQKLI